MAKRASRDTARIVNAYISADAQVRSRVRAFVERAWDGLDSYRDRDIDRFIRAVIPVVRGGQRQVASLTDAYLASIASEVLGAPTRHVGIPSEVITNARPVSPDEVYRRPGIEVWTALSQGKPLDAAVAAGKRRALSLALTDLQLAKTHAARSVMARDNRVVGHRRVLTGSEDCGLCRVAATQRYHKDNLQPIHPGCDCGVEPIYGSEDPGQVIDPESLDDTHAAVEDRFGVSDATGRDLLDYRKFLVVKEHGELGPLLTVKGQHFTGPSQI